MVVPSIIAGVGVYSVFHFAATDHHQKQFRDAFKKRVLPPLLVRHGLEEIESAAPVALERAVAFNLIAPQTRTRRDDAFHYAYRGATVTIAEFNALPAERKIENDRRPRRQRVPINGLLVQIAFPGRVPATTLVGRELPRPKALVPIRLEDPEFHEIYEVWGSDQIGCRTLLTPAVMHRLLVIADETDLLPPSLLAEDGTLTVLFEKATARDMFEPGKVTDPQMMRHLRQIADDFDAVMALVDDLLDVVDQIPGVRLGPVAGDTHPMESRL
nr:DUF3137 domain-containing protein [Jiella sonneratiae]